MDSNSFIQLTTLNFPEKYQFRLRKLDNTVQIFCPLRKKWLINTPEEWVRQHCIQLLHQFYEYPLSCIVAEYPIKIYDLNQRADLVVFKNSKLNILVECKRPSVALDQKILNQALRYTQILKIDTLFLTNGMQHLYTNINFKNKSVDWITELPYYKESTDTNLLPKN